MCVMQDLVLTLKVVSLECSLYFVSLYLCEFLVSHLDFLDSVLWMKVWLGPSEVFILVLGSLRVQRHKRQWSTVSLTVFSNPTNIQVFLENCKIKGLSI